MASRHTIYHMRCNVVMDCMPRGVWAIVACHHAMLSKWSQYSTSWLWEMINTIMVMMIMMMIMIYFILSRERLFLFSHTFSRRFPKQSYPKYTGDVLSKILEEEKHNYQKFCLNLWSSWNWVSCGESWKSLLPIFFMFHRTDFGGFLVCC